MADEIKQDRRLFLRNAAMTIAAAELGMIAPPTRNPATKTTRRRPTQPQQLQPQARHSDRSSRLTQACSMSATQKPDPLTAVP